MTSSTSNDAEPWSVRRLHPPRPGEPGQDPDVHDTPAPERPHTSTLIRRAIGRPGLPFICLGIAVAFYIVLFAISTVRDLNELGIPGFDLGIFDQGVWLLSRFKAPFVTVRGLNLFGDHTSFILLPLIPFYWFFDTASTLLVAQSAALGVAAVPAYLIAKEKLKDEWLALLIGIAFLLQPAVHWINRDNFHPDSFEIPLVLFAIYFMLKERWRPFFVFVGLALLVKEDVPLLTFSLGIYVAFRHNRRVGLVTAAVSLVWLALNLWVLIPAFNPG
ncbi:MAG: hypothetical protein QOH90_1517, partial [Actinomycetota bacterium]|nr:hypothetical protein [Actinomycetota bacterium]